MILLQNGKLINESIEDTGLIEAKHPTTGEMIQLKEYDFERFGFSQMPGLYSTKGRAIKTALGMDFKVFVTNSNGIKREITL